MDKKKTARAKEGANRRETKKLNLERNPRYCDHCGDRLLIDNCPHLLKPVCSKPECQAWWPEEVKRRASQRNREWKKRGAKHTAQRAVDKQPYVEPVDVCDDDWSEEKFQRAMKANQAPNGRKCRICGQPLHGVQRIWCEKHAEIMSLKADVTLCEVDFPAALAL